MKYSPISLYDYVVEALILLSRLDRACQGLPENDNLAQEFSHKFTHMSLDAKIKEANQKLRVGGTLVTIERRDKYLWLRGTLPPKPDLDRKDSYQQKFSLGNRAIATEAGLQLLKPRLYLGS